ncbi:MAG: SpoIIE family protein phosphatase, partial [Acutalibacteraceae bacterium]
IRIVFNERPVYDTEIGSCQHIAYNGKLCGDSINYFTDSLGNMVCMLSDGMGTGGRAAVDGNMTTSIMTKLIKAGLSPDCSLSVVNSSLMVKSEDESLATLDISLINRYTGKVDFLKAGATVTYVKKNGRIYKKDMPSLPLGILSEVKFSKDSINLSGEDMVVMISDGAYTSDDKWLQNLIKSWNESSCQELADMVVDEAIKRREKDHDDDITCVVVRMKDNM